MLAKVLWAHWYTFHKLLLLHFYIFLVIFPQPFLKYFSSIFIFLWLFSICSVTFPSPCLYINIRHFTILRERQNPLKLTAHGNNTINVRADVFYPLMRLSGKWYAWDLLWTPKFTILFAYPIQIHLGYFFCYCANWWGSLEPFGHNEWMLDTTDNIVYLSLLKPDILQLLGLKHDLSSFFTPWSISFYRSQLELSICKSYYTKAHLHCRKTSQD